jgi:uncharacterized HAD superfamily protein
MNHTPKIIAVDCDNTLTFGNSYTKKECLEAKPNVRVIKKINNLYRHNFIVIFTARRNFLIESTLEWLQKHCVNFHSISNNKIPSNVYIDADAIRPKELK